MKKITHIEKKLKVCKQGDGRKWGGGGVGGDKQTYVNRESGRQVEEYIHWGGGSKQEDIQEQGETVEQGETYSNRGKSGEKCGANNCTQGEDERTYANRGKRRANGGLMQI